MPLLVAEDERLVRSYVVRGLREEGFKVDEAADGDRALQALSDGDIQLAVLDWNLPGPSGLDVLRQLRIAGDATPVIMMTAHQAVADRTLALNEGADDYVVKPFAFEELLARVRAVLRRCAGRATPRLECADLQLDPACHSATRGGQELHLTAREFALLQFLLEHKGQVLSRTRIVEAVWDHDFETFSNIVEVYIRYLRSKVDEPFGSRLIHTVRGVGYVLREDG